MSWVSIAVPEPRDLRPSREEIEYLCLVHAVGPDGCATPKLAQRLGLSPELSQCIDEAVVVLLQDGRLESSCDSLTVTAAGREWLQRRLAELGIRP
jgi:hypothetical protein